MTVDHVENFGPVELTYMDRQTLEVTPRVAFRGEKLICTAQPKEELGRIRIVSISVNGVDQGWPDLPAAAFSPDALGNGMKLKAAGPDTSIAMRITYSGYETVTFDACLFGTAL